MGFSITKKRNGFEPYSLLFFFEMNWKKFLFLPLIISVLFSNNLFSKQKSLPKPRKVNKIHHKVPRNSLKITYNKIDNIVLGSSMKEIFWHYPKARIQKVLTYDSQGGYTQYEILSPDLKEVLFSIEPSCRDEDSLCIMKRINVKSKIFHTAKNIRIGMNIKNILNSKQEIKRIGWFEGNLVAKISEDQINCVLQTESIPKEWYCDMKVKSLPDSTQIIGFMLSGKDLNGFTFKDYDSVFLNRSLKMYATKNSKNHLKNKIKAEKNYYEVSKGETLYSISKKLKTSIHEILANNTYIKGEIVKIGDKISLLYQTPDSLSQALEIDPYHSKNALPTPFFDSTTYVFGSSISRTDMKDSLHQKSMNTGPNNILGSERKNEYRSNTKSDSGLFIAPSQK